MKIYTKTGDAGKTSLIGGTRVPKHHLRIETYGTVDELNSWIGLLRDQSPDPHSQTFLLEIQDRLFTIGALLATDPGKGRMQLPPLPKEEVEAIEQEIDRMEGDLSLLQTFILPGGHPLVSQTHITRCVCRRAERLAVHLSAESQVDPLICMYLNRLSDYLFVLSRHFGRLLHVAESPWNPRQ